MTKITTFPKERGNIKNSFTYVKKFKLPKNQQILDIGCNFGSLIYNLDQEGFKNVYGIDVRKEPIKKGKQKYISLKNRLQVYNGEKIPYKDNVFDIILMFDVIEHIPNIKNFLKKEVRRVLKPNGMFIFQTPNKFINIPWEIINQRSFTKYKSYHCSLQTYSSLKDLLINSGFEDIKIEKRSILTKHNKNKVLRKVGKPGLILLKLLNKLPLFMFPNFWGYCKNKKK